MFLPIIFRASFLPVPSEASVEPTVWAVSQVQCFQRELLLPLNLLFCRLSDFSIWWRLHQVKNLRWCQGF